MTIIDRLKQEIENKLSDMGMSPYQAAVSKKLQPDAIRRVLEGLTPKIDRVEEICLALDIPLSIGNAASVSSEMQGADADLTYIPELDVQFSAGHGSYPDDHALTICRRPFATKWLKDNGLTPKNLALVHVHGDSMEPLLKDKDMVMIDQSINRPVHTMPVAFRLHNDLYIKMCQATGDGRLELISINKAYDNIYIDIAAPPPDFKIVGAVVWHAHSWI